MCKGSGSTNKLANTGLLELPHPLQHQALHFEHLDLPQHLSQHLFRHAAFRGTIPWR